MSEKCICCGTSANIDGYVASQGGWVCVDCVAQGEYQEPLSAGVGADSHFYPPNYSTYKPITNNFYSSWNCICLVCREFFDPRKSKNPNDIAYCDRCSDYLDFVKGILTKVKELEEFKPKNCSLIEEYKKNTKRSNR